MNRAQRRNMQKWGMPEDPASQFYKAINDASSMGFYMMLVIPAMVTHRHFDKIAQADNKSAKLVDLCLDLYDSFQKGEITIEELNACLWNEAGVKIV